LRFWHAGCNQPFHQEKIINPELRSSVMANRSLFQSIVGKLLGDTNAINEAGGRAYTFTPKHALAQYAITGCLNSTYYAGAETQLKTIIELANQVEPEFIARTAIYCRERGFMKDTPALLCAILAVKNRDLLNQIFARVIDNGKMLRNFVQILRSGAVGRKSLGTLPKRLVREWLEARDEETVFRQSIGQSPSLADIVKMVHPKPRTKTREAFYGYLIGRAYEVNALPPTVRHYEAFKAHETRELPEVPFQLLTTLELTKEDWTLIARRAGWQMLRMNLNTFARHGVFSEAGLAELIARRLSDRDEIKKARVFPYQLLTAFMMVDEQVPAIVRNALQDALETAILNVPAVSGKIYICPDVSGSMSSPVTGYRKGSTSVVRCIDVAALIAAAVLRKNPNSEVLPFEDKVVTKLTLNARDSVMTNAARLASIGGGGTNCSAPLALLNKRRAAGDLVIFVSDNQSWVDNKAGRGSATMREWQQFQARNPQAKLICIDIQPYGTTQAAERDDILNIGGFSDQVFDVIAQFASGQLNSQHWVGKIEQMQL
jgi:60 kDa SS-A/Ro ribonucleoprotein